ncbi:MAG: hypothetical protein M5U12_04630 [Verrucomicrobia bacterium]|nr:hypothetical protein [Verrucomicrobiota bacterium]
MALTFTRIITWLHPCNPGDPRSESTTTMDRGLHGLHGFPTAGEPLRSGLVGQKTFLEGWIPVVQAGFAAALRHSGLALRDE